MLKNKVNVHKQSPIFFMLFYFATSTVDLYIYLFIRFNFSYVLGSMNQDFSRFDNLRLTIYINLT